MVRGRGAPALPDIRAAHQIVQTDIEEVSDGDQAVEVRKALIQFIALIGPIPNMQSSGHLFLGHFLFFSEQSDSFKKFHNCSLILLTYAYCAYIMNMR